jgi:large subunit ribosomal protein L46
MMMSSMLVARRIRPSLITTRSLSSTYTDEKKAKRELRRKQYAEHQERLERLQTRRDGRDRDAKKTEFKAWYDKRRTYHEIMDRKARQQGLEWKIAVAAVVERLPTVTPDKEEWESEYNELRKYLDSFGFEYPEELGMDKMDDAERLSEYFLVIENFVH